MKKYGFKVILSNMKVGERGQVTIPKELRDKFGLEPETEVEFCVIEGSIQLRKVPQQSEIRKWKGHCKGSLRQLGYSSVDQFIDDVRGR